MHEADFQKLVQGLAQSDAMAELFRRLEDKYVAGLLDTNPSDQSQREHCFRMVTAVRALRDEVHSIAQGTKVAEYNRRIARSTLVR